MTLAALAIFVATTGVVFLVADALMLGYVIAPIFRSNLGDTMLDGLRLGLEMQADGDASTSTMIEGYFSGRIRETWEYGRLLLKDSPIENGPELFDEVNQSLLIDRNAAWEPKIIEIAAGKSAVLAVGAAHLSGETGVLRALERAGYEISSY